MARYALVIGISRYDNFRNLDKAATDAAAIVRILQTHGSYQVEPLPKRLVEVENRWELATDKKLTGKDLGQALETFLLERAKDQEAVIYFAGHGFEVPGLGRKKKGYLATSDSTSDGRNTILFSDLNDLIRESSLSNLVLILDCCHAGSFLERTMLESTLTTFREKKDYYLITACRSSERAREGEEHGVFTAAVLKGLQRDNADSEGTVTGDRLFDFVQRELRHSGQEPIRTGTGRSITLMSYQPQAKTIAAIADERGEIVCPYQGLQAFTAKQREFFFGRKQIVEAIKQKLEQQPFVPIIGASGSGKSSVVRAGLMAWLEESSWHILEPIKPGFEPLVTLRGVFEPFFKRSRSDIQTLRQLIVQSSTGLSGVIERLPNDRRYLLVVDQFEEVFTVCADEAERQRFIELTTQVAEMQDSRLAVVTTMRADFLEPCLYYPSLHHLIQAQAMFMPPLTGVDLRDAIMEPAKRQGYTVEEALLLQILEDVGKEPGFLPLLEFALTKLWERRDLERHVLTLEQYEKLGGLKGSLNLHAQQVYFHRDYYLDYPKQERTEQEREWIKRIFLRLVRTGDLEQDTRQRQLKGKLLEIVGNASDEQEAFRELLEGEQGLVKGRLLVTDQEKSDSEPWVDLAHEALIDSWKQFAEWRQENRDLRRLIDRLNDAMREWLKNPEEANFLMGGLLAQIREKWSEIEMNLSPSLKDFYQKSDNYEKQLKRQQLEQIKQQDLLSSLGSALRSFNNINDFLSTATLNAYRLTNSDGCALLLLKSNGQIRLEQLHCEDAHLKPGIQKAFQAVIRRIESSDFDSSNSVNTKKPQSIADFDSEFNHYLQPDIRVHSVAVLSKRVEKGRLYVFSLDPHYTWTERYEQLVRLIADQTAVALERSEMDSEIRRKERLERELEVAAEIQLGLLPHKCPSILGVNLAARCQTAQRVGGNYYDFICNQATYRGADQQESQEIWNIVIGSVMGKGMSAGLIMTLLRGVLQTATLNESSPAKILQYVNQAMFTDLNQSSRFVTLFHSRYDPQHRLLSYSNAAHHPPLLWQAATGTLKWLDTLGMLIGLDMDSRYGEAQVHLQPGDTLIYYTDGFTNAANQDGNRYDENNLVKDFQWACMHYDNPQEILNYLFKQVDKFVGSSSQIDDDMTLIVMQIK